MNLFKAFIFALKGIAYCIRHERNIQMQLFTAILVCLAGGVLNISKTEWFVCIAAIAIVLSAEMFNTSIEHLCNLISKDYHPAIKVIKDVSAGAVLVVAIASALCGCIIFLPKIIMLF